MPLPFNAVMEWLRTEWADGIRHGTFTTREVARALAVTSFQAEEALDELERNGIVTKRISGQNAFGEGGVALYTLTVAGRSQVEPETATKRQPARPLSTRAQKTTKKNPTSSP